ncbi:hypothetical protein MKW92_042457 [Papaver armeniacum]|nr:hypothetical protein MKW92_042457 [Papaver armeniacum]
MNVAQIKEEKDLFMQPPPGFAPKVSNAAQGTCNSPNGCDNFRSGLKRNLGNTEWEGSCNGNRKEVASSGDIPNRVAEEVAEDDEPEPEPVIEEVAEECFAVDQIWAIYDYFEGMPRSYVWINRVDSPFKVDVTWLEFVAGNIDENAWKREVSCLLLVGSLN